jgi:hypothetical protein
VSVFETNIRILGGLLSAHYLNSYVCGEKEDEWGGVSGGERSGMEKEKEVNDDKGNNKKERENESECERNDDTLFMNVCSPNDNEQSNSECVNEKREENALPQSQSKRDHNHDNDLLSLCVDLADRLLKAFHTKTAMPYGTVNLRVCISSSSSSLQKFSHTFSHLLLSVWCSP